MQPAMVGMTPLGFAAFVTTVFFTVSFICASPENESLGAQYKSLPACYLHIGGTVMQGPMVG
jgi:hypothetical protein